MADQPKGPPGAASSPQSAESASTIAASASQVQGITAVEGLSTSRQFTHDRYEAHELLGEGGMGQVQVGIDSAIGREIAVKKIRPEHASSNEVRERFLREARVQARLQHPAIVPVYDMGRDAIGAEFFVMKRVTGRTLDDIVRALNAKDVATEDLFPRNKLLALFAQVCLAVEYAHSRGVVHRDLKPSNIMVGNFGEVYVLDWGLARLLDSAREHGFHEAGLGARTVQGQILGTPGYMAPEQVTDADRVDVRADIYALGAILFEILALVPLHQGATFAALAHSTLVGANARPSERRPAFNIPPELDSLCERALALEPEQRCASAREVGHGDRNLLVNRRPQRVSIHY